MKYLPLLMLIAPYVGISGDSQSPVAEQSNAPLAPGIHVVALGVSDFERSFRFYKDGLGFPTEMTPDGGIVLFTTSGAKMFLLPYADLARASGVEVEEAETKRPAFPGFVLSHGAATREDVDRVLKKAEEAGGKIIKPAHDVSWGAYVGYFADLDGYIWEVAYSDLWHFSPEGVLIFNE